MDNEDQLIPEDYPQADTLSFRTQPPSDGGLSPASMSEEDYPQADTLSFRTQPPSDGGLSPASMSEEDYPQADTLSFRTQLPSDGGLSPASMSEEDYPQADTLSFRTQPRSDDGLVDPQRSRNGSDDFSLGILSKAQVHLMSAPFSTSRGIPIMLQRFIRSTVGGSVSQEQVSSNSERNYSGVQRERSRSPII